MNIQILDTAGLVMSQFELTLNAVQPKSVPMAVSRQMFDKLFDELELDADQLIFVEEDDGSITLASPPRLKNVYRRDSDEWWQMQKVLANGQLIWELDATPDE